MWADLIRALALVCVIEGLMPFIAPQRWRDTMLRLAEVAPRQLRIFGAVMIAIGVVVLQLVHQL
ncbi:DUF2065 domain-containing protein [Salinisphaera sp. SPP-AMP-43]|uniref:DUF2065 domain-containing protein n=1 Tax=Salinisphaera sp. SPP-AMP-43 TaxID=3121288 RepID=UPI003C6DCF0F